MTVVEAIEVLAAGSGGGGPRARCCKSLLQHLERGLSLSRAMAATGAFTPVLVASITASERTSTLAGRPRRVLEAPRTCSTGSSARRSAPRCIPAVVVTLGVAITVFLLTFVIPRFSRIYAGSNTAELSTATHLVLLVSAWTKDHLCTVSDSRPSMARRGPARASRTGGVGWLGALAWLTDAWPALRRQVDHYRLATLYQSVALMFRGGYTLEEAMQVCRGLDLGATPAACCRGSAGRPDARGRSVAAGPGRQPGLTDVVTERMIGGR